MLTPTIPHHHYHPTTIETATLCRMPHLKMSPLVTISELHRYSLRLRRSNESGLLPAESLTIAGVDQQHPCYGVDDEPYTVAGRAPTKGTAPAFTPGPAGTGTAPDGPTTEALPL